MKTSTQEKIIEMLLLFTGGVLIGLGLPESSRTDLRPVNKRFLYLKARPGTRIRDCIDHAIASARVYRCPAILEHNSIELLVTKDSNLEELLKVWHLEMEKKHREWTGGEHEDTSNTDASSFLRFNRRLTRT